MEGYRNRRITMANSTSSGGSRPSPLCGGRRRVVATKKHGWSNPLSVNNSAKKLQRREISSKPHRSSAMTKSLHRFRNFRLTERYDIHDPVGQCSLVLPLLMKRAKVIEIVVVHDIVFALASSGFVQLLLEIQIGGYVSLISIQMKSLEACFTIRITTH